MDESEIDKLRKEAKIVMSGKELDEALESFELLEKSNKELKNNSVNIGKSNNINNTVHVSERKHPGFLKLINELYIIRYGTKRERDKLLDKVSKRYQEEDKLIKSIRDNFKTPEYVERIKNKFYWRKSFFQLSVLALLVSSVFLFSFLKEQNISEVTVIVIFTIIFGIAYFSLGSLLWRCPACNYKLDFSSKVKNKKFNTSSVKKCPRCYVPL